MLDREERVYIAGFEVLNLLLTLFGNDPLKFVGTVGIFIGFGFYISAKLERR